MFLNDDNNLFNQVWKEAKNYAYAIAMMSHMICYFYYSLTGM